MKSIDARRELAHPHARPEWFSGPVWIQELNEASEAWGLEIFAVFFDAGARTIPHTHSTGYPPSLPGRWHGSRPSERVALARGDPHVIDMPPVDPAGWPLGLGSRCPHARLGHVHGRRGGGRMIEARA